MKTLLYNDKHIAFFNSDIPNKDIAGWVKDNIDNENNIFKLNEPYSCHCYAKHNTITISGDEDLIELTIETIIPRI